MKKIKSLAAVFLALFILAAIPTQAFAAETHEGVATMHTHQWRLEPGKFKAQIGASVLDIRSVVPFTVK